MNVVHVVEAFGGGVFNFVAALVCGMPEYRHVIIYGLRDETPSSFEKYFPEDTQFHVWEHAAREIRPLNDVLSLTSLLSALRRLDNLSVVHLHSSKAGFLGRLACRLLGIESKIVYSPQGASFARVDVVRASAKMYACLEKLASMFGGEIVTSCASEADAFLKIGISSTTINNGIRCSGTQGGRTDPGTLVIGTANRITEQKNPTLFNEIARHFSGDAACSFVWIGDGKMRDKVTSPNIRITGWVSMEKLDELLGSINIYLSTSLWEGLPLSALHAMCAGKPMVLSNCTGHRDIVRSGVNGYLFEDLDEAVAHISKLKQDRELLAAMGQRSRDIVMKEFSLDKMIEQYRALYKALAVL